MPPPLRSGGTFFTFSLSPCATLPTLSPVRGLVLEDEFAALDEGVVVDAVVGDGLAVPGDAAEGSAASAE